MGGMTEIVGSSPGCASAREARLALMAARFETVARVAREASVSLSARNVSETVASAASDLLGTETTLWVRNDDGQFLATTRLWYR